jgi:hypothetical protein
MNSFEIKNIKSWRSERVQLDILNIEIKKQPKGGADRVSFFFFREIRSGTIRDKEKRQKNSRKEKNDRTG